MAPARRPLVRIDAAAAIAARVPPDRIGPTDPPAAADEAPQRIALQRSGSGPLIFHGLELWTADTREAGTPIWHLLRLFDLPRGRFVLSIARFADVNAKAEHSSAEILDSAAAVLDAARAFDPSAAISSDTPDRLSYRHAAERFHQLLLRQFDPEPCPDAARVARGRWVDPCRQDC